MSGREMDMCIRANASVYDREPVSDTAFRVATGRPESTWSA
jgi:hypothetical protein